MSELALDNRYQMVLTRVTTRPMPQLTENSRSSSLRSPKNHTAHDQSGRLSARMPTHSSGA